MKRSAVFVHIYLHKVVNENSMKNTNSSPSVWRDDEETCQSRAMMSSSSFSAGCWSRRLRLGTASLVSESGSFLFRLLVSVETSMVLEEGSSSESTRRMSSSSAAAAAEYKKKQRLLKADFCTLAKNQGQVGTLVDYALIKIIFMYEMLLHNLCA